MFNDVQQDKSKFDLDSDKYIFKLVRLEASEHAEYGPGVRWIFNVAQRGDPPSPIFDASTGDKLELWQTTNADLSPGVKAGVWAAALLQRPIEVGESGAKIADALIGKTMLGLWGVNPNSKTTPKAKGILSVEPYRAPAKAGAKAAAVAGADDDGIAF